MARRRNEGQTEVLHQPRLDTVLMVEETIRKMKEYPSRQQLWKALPKKMMYQTFRIIIDYLEKSGKILMCKDGKIIWTWNPAAVKRIMSDPRLIVR